MKEKIPEELRKEFEQAVLNADLDHWMVDNDRQFLDKIWDAVDKLFNQEVEKRIAERMPSKAEKEAAEIMQHLKAYGMIHTVTAVKYPEGTHEDFIKRADEWIWRFRSRLTCSEKQNNSQKTEGGQI